MTTTTTHSWHRRRTAWCATLLVAAIVSGCVWTEERRDKMDLGVDPLAGALANSAAFKDTIASKAQYQGIAPLRVRGIGLVVGLGNNGSTNCPRSIYDGLVQSLYKQHAFTSTVVGTKTIAPERLIADKDTAVVLVRGEVPPAATAGDRFDISVSAWPGTETTSLRGGRLYTTDLEIFRQVSPGQSISGQVVAKAAGPLFLNPFSGEDAPTKATELEGLVLGGGFVTEDRRVHLVLFQPSYQWARRIQDRINAFAPDAKRLAIAESPSYVRLAVPPEFRGDSGHYLALVQSLFLSRDPKFAALRAQELSREILNPTAPHARIALAFEALGRASLPVLDELYKHPKDYVGFHAAAAGLRLDDHVAGDVMIHYAEDPKSAFRFKAIRALAETKGMGQVTTTLRRLLDDEDPRVQAEAYEALIGRKDPSITSKTVGGDNFQLDVIPNDRASFIYCKRRNERRIALFGKELRIRPPVIYRSPDGSLMVTAGAGADELTVIRTVLASGSSSPPTGVPLSVPAMIELLGANADVDREGHATGMSVQYGAVVRLLYHLCQDGAIDANFVLEQPNVEELLGPTEREGRPESEL